MKLYTLALVLFIGMVTKAQNPLFVVEQIKVRGNCEMCKERIEKAVFVEKEAQGEWNVQTKILTVEYNEEATSMREIMKRVAEAGHDNELFLADDQVYKDLPDCCHYDREIPWDNIHESPGTHKDGNHNTMADGHVNNLEEEDAIELEDVVAVGNQPTTALDNDQVGLTLEIKEGELLKAACCNLSESFETNASVDVSYTNAVTGTKQLKMLGLNQEYTLITTELLPDVRGLSTGYGLNFMPGRWISGIQLTKGGSSVAYGYEAIAGHINTALFKPEEEQSTSLNLFADANGRVEGNTVHVAPINEKWGQTVMLHANTNLRRFDMNDDGFMDRPVGRQLNLGYLLKYDNLKKSGWGSQLGVNILNDNRLAGQMDFVENTDRGTNNAYGVGIDLSRFQIWNKVGHIFKGKPYQSIGIMNQFTYYEQDSYFGLRAYEGDQRTFYSNLIFESILGSTLHKYKTGLSFLYDQYRELYNQQYFNRTESVPGAFFEYTYTGLKFTMVAGARLDFHNLVGTQFTPRLNLKYDLFPNTILRASAGRGFRTANVFAENQGFFASNRQIQILSNDGDIYGLAPEIAWNYGLSIQQEFRFLRRKSTIVVDFFRTDFQNQVVVDLDASPQTLNFYNLNGQSYANSLQLQWDFEPLRRLETRLAYKYYNTFVDYQNQGNELPFTPRHRGFLNLAYSTIKNAKGKQWTFDTTLQWVGRQRIPNTSTNPEPFRLSVEADPFFLWNAQIARQLSGSLRLYAGAENILGYTQDMPIVDAQNPFGNFFDGGLVYAPIFPGNVYVGLDLNF